MWRLVTLLLALAIAHPVVEACDAGTLERLGQNVWRVGERAGWRAGVRGTKAEGSDRAQHPTVMAARRGGADFGV